MDDTVIVNVAQSTTELSHPETHGPFCKGLSRSVKSKVAAVHEINHEVAVSASIWALLYRARPGQEDDVHILDILK